MNERLKEFVEFLIIHGDLKSYSDFAKIVGRDRSQISLVLNGSRKATDRLISIVLSKFPSLNPSWIRYGEGPMLIPGVKTEAQNMKNVNNVKIVNNVNKDSASVANVDVSALRKRIAELELLLEEEKTRTKQYWAMIEKLTNQ